MLTAGRRRARRRALAPVVVLAGLFGLPRAAGAATGIGAAMVATCDTTAWSVELSLTNAEAGVVTVASFTASGVPDDAFAPLGTGTTIGPGVTVRGTVSGLALSLADVSVAVTVSGAADAVPIVRGISRPPGCDAPAAGPGVTTPAAITVPGTIAATSSRDSVAPTTAADVVTEATTSSTAAAATAATEATTTVVAGLTVTTVAVSVGAAPSTLAATAASVRPPVTATTTAPTTTSGAPTAATVAVASPSPPSRAGWSWLLALAALAGVVALLLIGGRRRRRRAAWVLPSVPATAVAGLRGADGLSVFLSACADDRDAVAELAAAFEANGFAVTHDLDTDHPDSHGARGALGRAIAHATAVLVVVSPAATRSVEVARHVAVADDTRTPVVPVLVAGEPVLEGLLGYVLADASPIDLRGPARRTGTARALQVVRAMVVRARLDPPPPGARPLPAPTALASQSGPSAGTPGRGASGPGRVN